MTHGIQGSPAEFESCEGTSHNRAWDWNPEEFERLARGIDLIYHGGAIENWVQSYDGLREANVLGTREVLRLACTERFKPVVFISSLSVCYSTKGARSVGEQDDPLPNLKGVYLGYAQSKCVAEALVQEAGERGLPVTVVRPALVSGHSESGRSADDDLLHSFLEG